MYNFVNNCYNNGNFLVLQITTSAAKKLWEKSGVGEMKMPTSGPIWRDSTWSTQGEGILTSTHRPYPHQQNDQNAGILR